MENLVGVAFTSGLTINLEPVVAALKELGPVRLRRAYGDLTKTVESAGRGVQADRELLEIRRMTHRNLFEFSDIPFLTAHKNTSDMHLALDAISVAYTNDGISHFAILASDRDYVPLFSRLRELGKTVIAIAVDPQFTNSQIREGSDVLLYYSNLIAPAEAPAPQPTEAPLELGPNLMDKYTELLARAISALERQNKRLVGSEVFQMMCRLESDFDPKLVGCSNFKAFALKVRDERRVRVDVPAEHGDMTFYSTPVALPSNAAAAHQSGSQSAAGAQKPAQDTAVWLRNAFDTIMKVPFPSATKREAIYQAIDREYAELIKDGPFSLVDLTDAVSLRLRPQGMDGGSVYKITLSLKFARCFSCRTGDNPNNPEIVGLSRPREDWEMLLAENLVRQVATKLRRTPTVSELSEVLYERDAQQRRDFCARILANVAD